MRRKGWLAWLLIGLGSQFQFWASLSPTEAFVLIAAPCLVIQEWPHMRKSGTLPFFWTSIFLVCGCFFACVINHSPGFLSLRGMAVCCIISCTVVVAHWILRTRAAMIKWYFVGAAFSTALSTFVLRHAGDEALSVEEAMEGPLFWLCQLSSFLTAPSHGWYLQMPTAYVVAAALFLALFGVLSSASGRSAAIAFICAAILAVLGGRKIKSLRRVSKYFWVLLLVGFMGMFALNGIYRLAATSGWLGEEALEKYESQTKGGTGVVQLLIGGRLDAFVGLLACMDTPLVGWGPWAADDAGYMETFLSKYGAYEDYRAYQQAKLLAIQMGDVVSARMIPVHSMITQFWCWYGIAGLWFVVYSVFIFIRFMRYDTATVPQWYYLLGCVMVGRFWNIAFSPFAQRFYFPLVVVMCLWARAVRLRRVRLPEIMIAEIAKNEAR